MVAAKESVLVLNLDDGIVETVAEDVAGGVITRSENTRLTKLKGTTSRRPATETMITFPLLNPDDPPPTCGALVPGPGRSNLAVFPPAIGSRRFFGTDTEVLRGTLTGTDGQNAFYPASIDFATTIDGGPTSETPATIIDNEGRQWTVSIRQTGDLAVGLFVSVHLNGATVVSSRKVFDLTTGVAGLFALRFFCGITLTEDDVVLWFEQSTGIYAAACAIDSTGMGLTVGAATLICLPQNPTAAPSLYRPADVVSNSLSRAFLITRSTTTKTNVEVREIDQGTLTVTSTKVLDGTVGDTGAIQTDTLYLAVQFWPLTDQVMYAFSHNFGSDYTRFGVFQRTTGITVWHSVISGDYGPCGVQPMRTDGTLIFALASTKAGDAFSGTAQRVGFTHRIFSSGASIGAPLDYNLYWYQLQSRGAYIVQDDTFADIYAIWSVMPCWGPSTAFAVPGDDGYVIDPSVEIITYGHGTYTPVARVGVDRASMRVGPRNSSALAVNRYGRTASIVYAEKRFDIPRNPLSAYLNQDGARAVMLDFRPEHTRVTQSANGASFIAGAMPVAWDGVELVEAGPLHRTRVKVTATGGSGPDLTGTFSVVAVYSWRDSAGNVHRSAPSLPFTITLAGTKPIVDVTVPFSFRDGITQELPTVILYWTPAGSTAFYAQPPILRPVWYSNAGYVQFTFCQTPTAIDGDLLYSTGAGNEPLLPECPPPAWDMQTIDGRVWLIDGEDRNVVLPSLLKGDSQVTYEFNASMRIASFDPQYGRLVGIAKYGETLIFAERCIWQVSGNGPDNSGQGQTFVDPRIVSYVGCRNRSSICQVPGVGVLFQADDGRMALFAGQVQKFDTFGVYDVCPPTLHRQENEVIYPIATGGYIVYNWVKQGWTYWPDAAGVKSICTVPGVTLSAGPTGESITTRTYMYRANELVYMDSTSVADSSTGDIVVERGWIAPEGPQGDCVIREVWLQALNGGGQHGVTIRVSFNYNTTSYVERTWSAAEIAALSVDGRYTLMVSTEATPSRAVKVRVTATPVVDESGMVGEIMQPLNLSVVYAASPGLRRATLAEGAMK